uniref:Uncharacterized protein n=1 Tax=Solanum tuberosum TaxID=4113 RepID=M1D851_SOLTU
MLQPFMNFQFARHFGDAHLCRRLFSDARMALLSAEVYKTSSSLVGAKGDPDQDCRPIRICPLLFWLLMLMQGYIAILVTIPLLPAIIIAIVDPFGASPSFTFHHRVGFFPELAFGNFWQAEESLGGLPSDLGDHKLFFSSTSSALPLIFAW